MDHHDTTVMLLALGLLVLVARGFGELAQRWGQPAVLGEILAGILLGKTILGAAAPGLHGFLFPAEGGSALFLEGFSVLAISLYMLVAGIEVELSSVWRQGKAALIVGSLSTVIPFALGFVPAWYFPEWFGLAEGGDKLVFALFFATALSVTALPVIAKTMMDLDVYKTDFGMVVIAAAVLNDLTGGVIFAILLGMMDGGGEAGHGRMGTGQLIGLTLGFGLLVLTAGRWLIHKILPWLQAHTTWPGGILSFALGLTLLGAAFTEWLGIHAIFGAFLVGVALGDSSHLRNRTRSHIEEFISYIFAPIFFASIGLQIDFASSFNLPLVVAVFVIACAGKIGSGVLAGKICGMSPRESWAVAFGMNARGTIEIILGLLALKYGLISNEMFVALVIMAIVTSMMAGPAIEKVLQRRKPRELVDFLDSKAFVDSLKADNRREAIRELSEAAARALGGEPDEIDQVAWRRETVSATGIGSGIAIPHARLPKLDKPLVALGISERGVDFNSPDGKPAHLIFLVLTPASDGEAQLQLLANIGRAFRQKTIRSKALETRNLTELIALLKTETEEKH